MTEPSYEPVDDTTQQIIDDFWEKFHAQYLIRRQQVVDEGVEVNDVATLIDTLFSMSMTMISTKYPVTYGDFLQAVDSMSQQFQSQH